ncbi:MAG: SMP-30/gluconolactonase/LRE family protein [Reinekea sp.]|nr:SMP-30/gluconolactonase/LRE family protein [Reinekea sp.]
MNSPTVIAKLDMALGECPRWNAQEQAWYWVDILGHRFYRFDTQTDTLETKQYDFAPACFAFTERNHIVLTSAKGVYWLDTFNSAPRLLINPESNKPANRFNDGVTTPDGAFIAGTIGDGSQPQGTAYRLSLTNRTMRSRALQSGYTIINGQAFSPDGRWYYVTDTPNQKIVRYPYQAENGQLGEAELFYQCESDEFPDGAAIDTEGNYWVAMYGAGKVAVISAQGRRIREIPLPVSQPTMVAFGGPNLDQLLITTAAQTLSDAALAKEPLAGSVLLLQTDSIGTVPASMTE